MSTLPPELASVLASINARLGAIEAAIGGAGGGAAPEGDAYCRLANDFQMAIVNASGAKLLDAAEKCGGEEGKKLVRTERRRVSLKCRDCFFFLNAEGVLFFVFVGGLRVAGFLFAAHTVTRGLCTTCIYPPHGKHVHTMICLHIVWHCASDARFLIHGDATCSTHKHAVTPPPTHSSCIEKHHADLKPLPASCQIFFNHLCRPS
jgi:hypothetical protein